MRLLAVHRWRHRKGGAEGVHLDHLALFRERGWACADFAVDHPDNEPSDWSGYFPAPFAPRRGVAGLVSLPRFFHSREAGENFARLLDDFRPDVIHAHGIYHHLTNAILAPARQRGVPIVYTLHDYKLICPAYHFYTPQNGVCERCRGGQQWRCLTNRCTQGPLAMDALYALDGWIQWHGGALKQRRLALCRAVPLHRRQVRRARLRPRKVALCAEFLRERRRRARRSRRGRGVARSARPPHPLFRPPVAGKGRRRADRRRRGRERAADDRRRRTAARRARSAGARARRALHVHRPSQGRGAVGARSRRRPRSPCPLFGTRSRPRACSRRRRAASRSITTRIGGLPELVEHGENGLLVEPGDRAGLADALRRALAMDEGSLAAMGAKGRQQATTRFTRDRYYREMTALYAELVPALQEAAE